MMLTGEEVQPAIFRERIDGSPRKGKALVFDRALNIYCGFLKTLEHYDIILVVPLTPIVMLVGRSMVFPRSHGRSHVLS